MVTGKAPNGKPYAGNPHVRLDEGEVVPAVTPRRGSLLCQKTSVIVAAIVFALAATGGEVRNLAPLVQGVVPARTEAVKRWRDLRFGMFIHWGPVSLTGKEIGWSRGLETPVEEYDSLYKRFNPEKFNADEWVSIVKSAGMRHIVLTTKHHDGFCLWDTKETGYNVLDATEGPTFSEVQNP